MAFLLRVIVDEHDAAGSARPYHRGVAGRGADRDGGTHGDGGGRVTGYLFGAAVPAGGQDADRGALRDPAAPPALSQPG